MKPISIGIDIGGTNTKYGIADREGNILASNSIPTTNYPDPKVFVKAMHQAITDMIADCGEEVELLGIGIGAPNANYYTGTIEEAPNLSWKGVVPLVKYFEEYFPHASVVITNDANAAAIGEMIYGGAKGMRDFCVITLGTGVGSGFVVNGGLVYGHDGFAGEFGHVIAVPGGRLCTCGRRGCVETYGSARGVVLSVQEELAGTTSPSKLRSIAPEDMTPKDVFLAAESGDVIAQHAFEATGKVLGESLANLVAFTSPEAIFFFGGVAKAGKWILEPIERHLKQNLLNIYQKNMVKLIPSYLPESDAAILGASSLVWKEVDHMPSQARSTSSA
ncbi:MAG: ROK family protein [Bacteroidetes bacterium]|nr:MAG: ROK family protein [Bacteroidota bacterium]